MCKYHPEIVADNLVGLVIQCPVCDVEITLGQPHPEVQKKEKRYFRYKKDLKDGLASGKEIYDSSGWVNDWVLDSKVKAKPDWYHRESNSDFLGGLDTPLSIPDQKIILKNGKTKYNCLVYDINRGEDVVTGYYMARRGVVKVEQVGDNVWWELGRERIEWATCEMCEKPIFKSCYDENHGMCYECASENGE